jgi:CDP-glycerol glycerophosphotransferase (TagB/SpsB family)
MGYAMFRPIHERLRADPHLEVSFTANHKAKELYRSVGLNGVRIVSKRVSYFQRYDMCICPSFFYERKNAGVRVQIFHGVSLKNRAVHRKSLDYDTLFLVGPYMKQKFMETWGLSDDDPRFEMIGMPKLDRLVDGSLHRRMVEESLNIDRSLPTVIYAPTRPTRTSSSLAMAGEEIISTISEMNVNFLVKLHDRAYREWRSRSSDWRAILKRLEKQNVRIVEDYDIVPYLYVSDLLVSDISSVVNEYTLLDRPIVLFDVPRLIQFHKRKEIERGLSSSDLEEWGRDVGTVVKDMEGLKGAIERGLSHPEEKRDIRREFAERFFFQPGSATDRAVQKIYELLGLEGRDG